MIPQSELIIHYIMHIWDTHRYKVVFISLSEHERNHRHTHQSIPPLQFTLFIEFEVDSKASSPKTTSVAYFGYILVCKTESRGISSPYCCCTWRKELNLDQYLLKMTADSKARQSAGQDFKQIQKCTVYIFHMLASISFMYFKLLQNVNIQKLKIILY